MQLLIIEQSEAQRADIQKRVEEASRSTGLRNIGIEAVEMKQIGSIVPDLIILGNFAKDQIQEINSRLNSIFPNIPIILLLNTEDYLEDAVELHKRTSIRIIASGDLPQISQVLIDLAQPTIKSSIFLGKAKIISFVSIKGGVGTSTLVASTAEYYAENKISTLIIDLNYSNQDLSTFYEYSIEGKSAFEKSIKIAFPEIKDLKPLIENVKKEDTRQLSIIGHPNTFLDSYQFFTNTLPINEINSVWIELFLSKISSEFEIIIIDLGNHWGISTLASLANSTNVCLVMEEDEWCIKRSFSMINKISSESEDPAEFDFRKWKFLINGMKSQAISEELVTKYNAEYNLVQKPSVNGFPWSKKSIGWNLGNQSAYKIGEISYKESISNFAKQFKQILN
jgi:cellulose biosynthesis protein BcsQ